MRLQHTTAGVEECAHCQGEQGYTCACADMNCNTLLLHCCNTLLQHATTATRYCSTILQHTTAEHYCNIHCNIHCRRRRNRPLSKRARIHLCMCSCLLQHTAATHYCNKTLTRTTLTHYCNMLLQHAAAGGEERDDCKGKQG